MLEKRKRFLRIKRYFCESNYIFSHIKNHINKHTKWLNSNQPTYYSRCTDFLDCLKRLSKTYSSVVLSLLNLPLVPKNSVRFFLKGDWTVVDRKSCYTLKKIMSMALLCPFRLKKQEIMARLSRKLSPCAFYYKLFIKEVLRRENQGLKVYPVDGS